MTAQNAKPTGSQFTADELSKLIAADRQRRVEAAQAGIQAVLNAQNCQLQARPQIVDGLIIAVIQIAPNSEVSS